MGIQQSNGHMQEVREEEEKMSEPWEVEQDKDNGRNCWNVCEGDQVVFTCYSNFIADRACLEHNACEGISDEEVKNIPKWKRLLRSQHVSVVEVSGINKALKAQLDETVALLEKIRGCNYSYLNGLQIVADIDKVLKK